MKKCFEPMNYWRTKPQNSKDLRIKFHSTESKAFTTEFYNCFWSDLKYFAVRSFNQAYTRGYLSVSQRQWVITCLPKEGKSKCYLQNWCPISLLNVDYKMCASAITLRFKKVFIVQYTTFWIMIKCFEPMNYWRTKPQKF
jgi:hypothetical protein